MSSVPVPASAAVAPCAARDAAPNAAAEAHPASPHAAESHMPGVTRADDAAVSPDVTAETLTPRQAAFCESYLRSGNAALAARRAGYAPASAAVTGHRLLRNAKIRDHLSALRRDLGARNAIDMDTMLAKLERLFVTAVEQRAHHAAVRAAALQAQLVGLFPEQRAVFTPYPAEAPASPCDDPATGVDLSEAEAAEPDAEPDHEAPAEMAETAPANEPTADAARVSVKPLMRSRNWPPEASRPGAGGYSRASSSSGASGTSGMPASSAASGST